MAEMRSETRYARQLFLHGDGSGGPVRNIPRLSKLSGVTDETIRKYLPEWEKESAELLASSSAVGLAITLSEKNLEQLTKDSIFIRNQLDKLKSELENLQKMGQKLEKWLDNFREGDVETALKIFDSWQRTCGQESALRSQFVAMKRLWDEKIGADALRDVALTAQKEVAKGQAKMRIKEMEAEKLPETPRVVTGGVFARPE
jgi:DNA-binding transcriptional MerR regulator